MIFNCEDIDYYPVYKYASIFGYVPVYICADHSFHRSRTYFYFKSVYNGIRRRTCDESELLKMYSMLKIDIPSLAFCS